MQKRARIVSTGSYVPSQVVTNHDISRRVDTSDAWIVERTGIRERRIAGASERSSDMAAEAARQALEAGKMVPADLELIVVGTISPDQPLPACAVHVQRKLGARCPAFDLSAACAGFLYGLDVASRYVATGSGPVLVVGVELLSRLLDWEDRETCILFGDGAGAAIVDASPDQDRGIFDISLGADGRHHQVLSIPGDRGVVRMKGPEVFRLAVNELSAACSAALEQAGLGPQAVDHVVAHQANIRILEAISRRCRIPWDRFHITIDRYGNTSSASIPLGLDHANRAGKLEQGQVILLAALGAGVVFGAGLMRW